MAGRFAILPIFVAAYWSASLLLAGTAVAAPPPAPEISPVDKIDDRAPIPPENNKQTADLAKLRIKNKEHAIFHGSRDKHGVVRGGIEDDKPLASEKQNSDEYQALTAVFSHATQFTPEVLAENGRRDLTPDDLTYDARFQFRLELLRFEGKVAKARRLLPTRSMEQSGFKELFEAWLVPDEESPGYPLCLLMTSWPEGFAKLPAIPEGHSASPSVAIDKWAAFGGYSFKLMSYPGPKADPKNPTGPGWLKAPLLLGQSLVPLPEPKPKIEVDKNLRVFKDIRDKTRLQPGHEAWEERTAWNHLVLHARKFTAEQLEKAANRNVSFADLFHNPADHRFDPIYFHGRLVRLSKSKSPPRLADAGLDSVYEAWIIPNKEPRGNPICVVLVDLPDGLEPMKSMNVSVTVAGFSFKLWRYESGELDKYDPKKHVDKYAPLLIGRSLTVRPELDADVDAEWSSTFVPAVVGTVVFLGGAALLMSWWFRSGDRAAKAEIDANRGRNPFGNEGV